MGRKEGKKGRKREMALGSMGDNGFKVNRARHCPTQPFLLATKTTLGDVLIFDYSKFPSQAVPDGICRPTLTLKSAVECDGYSGCGFMLPWSCQEICVLASLWSGATSSPTTSCPEEMMAWCLSGIWEILYPLLPLSVPEIRSLALHLK